MCIELTISIPVYNEAANIAAAISKIERDVAYPHIINIIYDMDSDTTIPPVRALQPKYLTEIRLIKNKYGRGALNAIKTGLEETNTVFAVVTMADLCDPPDVINKMVETAKAEGADIVCGSRYMKGGRQIGGPFIKSLMSRTAGVSLHLLAGVPTHDATNSFKLYRKSFLNKQTIESTGGFELGIELVAKAYAHNYKICEVPTTWTDRAAGKSNFKVCAWTPKYLKWYLYSFRIFIHHNNKGN